MGDRQTGQISENSKRIAKNTLALYFRMFLLMAIGLYTSRVVLNALGETDFGIYGAVGGIVSMCSLLSGSLASAISRFLTVELGKNDVARLREVFSMSIIVILLYQGSIAMLASVLAPLLSDAVIAEMSCVGSLLIIAISLNMLKITNIKVMNLIPAIFLPILLCTFM